MPRYETANTWKDITRLDVEEWKKSDSPDWVKALAIFLYLYGLRIGEALELQAWDFYIDENYLYLNAPKHALEKNPDPYPRRLPLSLDSPGIEYLKEYIENKEDDEYLFPYTRQYCWRKIKELDEELSPHVFRHHRHTEFFIQGATEIEVQTWMGHSDTRTASRYRHKSGVFTERLGKRTKII